jgi:hypothetical protein
MFLFICLFDCFYFVRFRFGFCFAFAFKINPQLKNIIKNNNANGFFFFCYKHWYSEKRIVNNNTFNMFLLPSFQYYILVAIWYSYSIQILLR